MFRRLETGLAQDPRFPADLNALGFFINDQHQIRKIKQPDKEFVFRITNDERTNEVHREAFHIAVRKQVRSRLKELGFGRIYLPHLTTKKPKAPHVAIIATPPSELRLKKHVIVVVNDEFQDLGIFAWRMLARESGIEEGSCIALIKELMGRSAVNHGPSELEKESSKPGIVVLNPGELNYSYSLNESMSRSTWFARNAPSAAHPSIPIHTKNLVDGHKTPEEHVAAVFEQVISNSKFVHPDAEIYVIGMQGKGDLVLQYLDSNWRTWSNRIMGVALMEPQHSANSIKSQAFKTFLEQRGRAWMLSAAPVGTPIAAPRISTTAHRTSLEPLVESGPQPNPLPHNLPEDVSLTTKSASTHTNWCENLPSPHNNNNSPIELSAPYPNQPNDDGASFSPLVGINEVFEDLDLTAKTQPIYSAGDLTYSECIFPTVYRTVLDWFEEVASAPSSYVNPMILESELWQPRDVTLNNEEQDLELAQHEKDTLRVGEIGEVVATGDDGGTNGLTLDSVLQEREYAGGETDAMEEHGGFVAKELAEPTVEVAGAKLPASLIAGAGLGDEDVN